MVFPVVLGQGPSCCQASCLPRWPLARAFAWSRAAFLRAYLFVCPLPRRLWGAGSSQWGWGPAGELPTVWSSAPGPGPRAFSPGFSSRLSACGTQSTQLRLVG